MSTKRESRAHRLSDEEALSHLRPATSQKGGFFAVFLGRRKAHGEAESPTEKRKPEAEVDGGARGRRS